MTTNEDYVQVPMTRNEVQGVLDIVLRAHEESWDRELAERELTGHNLIWWRERATEAEAWREEFAARLRAVLADTNSGN
jgi:hypothetical protein